MPLQLQFLASTLTLSQLLGELPDLQFKLILPLNSLFLQNFHFLGPHLPLFLFNLLDLGSLRHKLLLDILFLKPLEFRLLFLKPLRKNKVLFLTVFQTLFKLLDSDSRLVIFDSE